MRTGKLKTLCDAFIQERNVISNCFLMTCEEICALSASMLITRVSMPDRETIDRCKYIFLDNCGIFSPFRGAMQAPVVALMAASDDALEKLARLEHSYSVLRKFFDHSLYLVYSAAVLSELPDEMQEGTAARAKEIYYMMEKIHPKLTDDEDTVLSLLFAMSGRPKDELFYEAEYIYNSIRDFGEDNTMQSAAHILTLADGQPDAKTQLFRDIWSGLANHGLRYGEHAEMIMLAALASVAPHAYTAVIDTIMIEGLLSDSDSYNGFLASYSRSSDAALITAAAYTPVHGGISGSLSMTAAEFTLLYMYDSM